MFLTYCAARDNSRTDKARTLWLATSFTLTRTFMAFLSLGNAGQLGHQTPGISCVWRQPAAAIQSRYGVSGTADAECAGLSRMNSLPQFTLSVPLLEAADVDGLEQLGDNAVAHQGGDQPWEVGQWQRLQADERAQRGEGHVDADGHDQGRHHCDRQRGSALEERDLAGAQHVHHQGLRQQAFDEPAGLEQGLHFHAVGCEHVPHQGEGRDVEDRRGRPDPDHETPDVFSVPLAWFAQVFLVHLVPRQGQLGDVVHQVLQQQMDCQHRQERYYRSGYQHREHVAEVGAGRHVQVLHDVAERFAAFEYAFFQHHQALLEQDDVRRLLGDVRAAVHGNAHVCVTQGWGIVDAVAQETHGVAIRLQGLEHPGFLQRGQFGENGTLLDHTLEHGVIHVLDFLAQQWQAWLKAYLTADLAGHNGVVTGQHLDPHADLTQCGNSGASGFLRWIEEGQEAADHQIPFIGGLVLGLGVWLEDVAGADGQHPEAVLVVVIGQCQQVLPTFVIERDNGFAFHHVGGNGQHFLDGTLADQQVVGAHVLDDDRQATTDEVERQFIDLGVAGGFLEFGVCFRELHHGLVHQVFHAALVVAVKPGQGQDRVIALAADIDVVLEDDLVLGQGAGLVGAQHVHGAEVLDGVQALDHHLAPGHGHGALGEVGADDHRQHFRGQADGDRQGEEQGVAPVAFGKAVEQEHYWHHHQHETDQQPADAVHPAVKGGLHPRADNRIGQRAEVGARASGDHHGLGGAADHVGAHEADVLQVQQIARVAAGAS